MNETEARFEVKRTGTGLGLFTKHAIKRGERIVEYVGEIITNEEADRRGGKYLFQLSARRVIDGKERGNIARYLNHSCRPNAKGYTVKNKIWVFAEKNIRAGDQITIDYGDDYFEQHIKPIGCKCESCARRQSS